MSKHSTGFQSDPFSSQPCESCESKRWAIKDVCYACGKDCCDKCATHVGGNKLICAECKESQDAEQAPVSEPSVKNLVHAGSGSDSNPVSPAESALVAIRGWMAFEVNCPSHSSDVRTAFQMGVELVDAVLDRPCTYTLDVDEFLERTEQIEEQILSQRSQDGETQPEREAKPTCPTCGQETTFTHWSDATDEWLVCDKCGAKTDETEVTA